MEKMSVPRVLCATLDLEIQENGSDLFWFGISKALVVFVVPIRSKEFYFTLLQAS